MELPSILSTSLPLKNYLPSKSAYLEVLLRYLVNEEILDGHFSDAAYNYRCKVQLALSTRYGNSDGKNGLRRRHGERSIWD